MTTVGNCTERSQSRLISPSISKFNLYTSSIRGGNCRYSVGNVSNSGTNLDVRLQPTFKKRWTSLPGLRVKMGHTSPHRRPLLILQILRAGERERHTHSERERECVRVCDRESD